MDKLIAVLRQIIEDIEEADESWLRRFEDEDLELAFERLQADVEDAKRVIEEVTEVV